MISLPQHRIINAFLAAMLIVLLTRFPQVSPEEEAPAPPKPPATASPISDEHPLSPPSKVSKRECHSNFIKCFHGGEAQGSLQQWSIFGEVWANRQMFRTVPPVAFNDLIDLETALAIVQQKVGAPAGWTIRSLNSSAAGHSTWLMHSASGCEGIFAVKASAPKEKEKLHSVVHGRDVVDFLFDSLHIGSDDFRVRLVGDEVASSILRFARSTGETTGWYLLPFSFHSKSIVHIEAEQMYADYEAFDEHTAETIRMIRKPLLALAEHRGAKGEIAGAQHHNPKYNLYHFGHPEHGKHIRKGKFRSSKLFTWDQFTYRSEHQFQCSPQDNGALTTAAAAPSECSDSCFSLRCCAAQRTTGKKWTTPFGIWKKFKYNGSFPQHLSTEEMKLLPEHHVHFERTDPQAVYAFTPYSHMCSRGLRGFTPEMVGASERKRTRWVFVGDSHIRVTYVHFRNFLVAQTLCPLEDHGVKSMSGKSCVVNFSNSSENIRELEISYVNDILLEKFVHQPQSAAGEVLVLGMGSWAIGGQGTDPQAIARAAKDFGRWSIAKYGDAVSHVASVVTSIFETSPHVRVAWMAMPAYPPNTRRFAKLKGEYRTNPRIYSMNQLALRRLLSGVPTKYWGRISFIDSFDVTYPMMHLSLDHNHFTTYPQDALLHLLLNAVV